MLLVFVQGERLLSNLVGDATTTLNIQGHKVLSHAGQKGVVLFLGVIRLSKCRIPQVRAGT